MEQHGIYDKDKCHYTLLKLLRELEENKVGGISFNFGGFDWKEKIRDLGAYGVEFLQIERRLIKDTRCAINNELFHLKQKPYDKAVIEKAISDIINEKMHTSVVDYYIRKAIIDGEYDNETIHFFLTSRETWDKSALQYLLQQKASRLNKRIKIRCSDHDDDFLDPEFLILLLDFAIDGVIDIDFIDELNGEEIEGEGFNDFFEKESVVERTEDYFDNEEDEHMIPKEDVKVMSEEDTESVYDINRSGEATDHSTYVEPERNTYNPEPERQSYSAPTNDYSEPSGGGGDCSSSNDE